MEDALNALIKTIGDGVLEYVQKGIAEMELPKPEPDNTTYTPQEAAEYLGVCKTSIYRGVRQNAIPHFRPTKNKILIHKRELDRWIKGGGSG